MVLYYFFNRIIMFNWVEVDVWATEDSYIIVPVFKSITFLFDYVDLFSIFENVLSLILLKFFFVTRLCKGSWEHVDDIEDVQVHQGVQMQVGSRDSKVPG